MTDRATYGDEPQLRELWKLVFGDGDRFLDSFFGNLFRPDECLVTRDGGQITAMLFMLPCVWSDAAADRPMRYVYACATHPAYRRQGLMGRLLEEAARYAAGNGLELSLVPEDHLVEYYGRFGFTGQTYLYMRKYPAPAAPGGVSAWRKAENDAALLGALRTRFWQGRNAVLWPEEHLRVALGEIAEQGGEFLVMKTGGGLPAGYALAVPDGETIRIIECASALPQDDMINSLRSHYKNRPALFSLADGIAGSCAETLFGLVRTRDDAKDAHDGEGAHDGNAHDGNAHDGEGKDPRGIKPPYLNLALDF